MIITVDKIMEKRPCPNWPRERVELVIGDGLSHTEFAKIQKIPWKDRVWGLLQFIPTIESVRLACKWARDVLPIYEAQYPDDKRPRLAIEAAEYVIYGTGLANIEEAERAAWDAAAERDAGWDVAAMAADAAAMAARSAWAAWAARAAARAARAVRAGGAVTEQSVLADILAVYDKMEAEKCTSQTIQA